MHARNTFWKCWIGWGYLFSWTENCNFKTKQNFLLSKLIKLFIYQDPVTTRRSHMLIWIFKNVDFFWVSLFYWADYGHFQTKHKPLPSKLIKILTKIIISSNKLGNINIPHAPKHIWNVEYFGGLVLLKISYLL